MMRCWNCGTLIEASSEPLKIGKSENCPDCDSDLHVCKNCRFYDRASYNECKETQAEWVREKEKRNYCDYFEPNTVSTSKSDKAKNARSTFDRLFKD
jgi:hypothetical protein